MAKVRGVGSGEPLSRALDEQFQCYSTLTDCLLGGSAVGVCDRPHDLPFREGGPTIVYPCGAIGWSWNSEAVDSFLLSVRLGDAAKHIAHITLLIQLGVVTVVCRSF